MNIFQKGFNFSQDGPGNRLVYHLQGCNFHCPWCSNPESMPILDACIQEQSIEDIIDECVRSTPLFFSGGGVTFTGGEPTLQFDELRLCLEQLKFHSIHTAIETNGSAKRLLEIIPLVDFLIVDFKHPDTNIHNKWIKAENEGVVSNLKKILEINRQILIRIPLINGFNTEPYAFIDFFSDLTIDSKNVNFEILPYHEYGKEKWTEPYTITDGFVTTDKILEFKKAFADNNLKLITT